MTASDTILYIEIQSNSYLKEVHMKALRQAWFSFVVGICTLLPGFALAQVPAYSVDYMGPGYGTMNNAGVVIGNESAVYPGTPWVNDGSGLQYLPLPVIAVAGSAADINDAGVIVGAIDTDDDFINDIPVKWTPDGHGGYVVDLLPLAGSALRGHAVAINNNGVILATGLAIGSLPTYTAYVIDGETITHVGLSNPMDINDNGIILTNNQLYDYYTATSLGFDPLPADMPQGYLYPASINNFDEVIVNILTTIIGHTRYHAIGIYTVGVGWDLFMDVQTVYSAGSINDNGDVTLHHVNSGCGLVYLSDLGFYCPASLLDEGSLDWAVSGASVIATDGTILARGGNSGTSQYGLVRLSAAGDLSAPTAPVNLAAVPHEATWQQPWNAIGLSWENTSELTLDYTIERRVSGAPDWVVINSGWRVATMWDMDVGLGVTYNYRVRARGLVGLSEPSVIATATAPATPADNENPVVNIVTPADGSSVSGNVDINVEASDNIGVTHLDILVTSGYNTEVLCSIFNSSTLTCSWNTQSLAPGQYTIQARASDAMNNGALDSITVTVGNANPELRSSDIQLSARLRKGVVSVSGKVVVIDETGAAVRSAMVEGRWTRPDGSTIVRYAYSNKRGQARFSTSGDRGTYTLTVANITKTGYTFDSANSVLSESVTK